jgi:adenosylhomocysteine nucleosidase
MQAMKIEEIAVIMALPLESQGLFEAENITVHFCGIGKVNAAAKCTEVILKNKPKHILNLGTAGSSKFKTHTLVECDQLVQRDMDLSPLGFPLGETPMDDIKGISIAVPARFSELEKGICGTGDSFQVGPAKVPCDLVDMEAYAIAKVCKRFGIGFTALKYITDGADHTAHNDWAENLKPGAKKLLQYYQLFCTQHKND